MKISFLFVLLFFVFSSLLGQISTPDSIVVKYYVGGDYRTKDIRGSSEGIDSLIFVENKNDEFYIAEKSYHTVRIFPYENGKVQSNIWKDSSWIRPFDSWIQKSEIEYLLDLIDPLEYENYLLRDTSNSEFKFISDFDTILIPIDFSLDYYSIDTTHLDCLCEYFFHKIKQEDLLFDPKRNCDTPIDYDYLKKVLIGTSSEIHISSYFIYISVKLVFENSKIEIYQSHPERINTRWRIYKNDSEKSYRLLNPEINNIVHKLFPPSFSNTNEKLIKYSNLQFIFDQYFNN